MHYYRSFSLFESPSSHTCTYPFLRILIAFSFLVSNFPLNSRIKSRRVLYFSFTLLSSRAFRSLATIRMPLLNRLNPTPAFPAHTGPYKVGSADVEIPSSELASQSENAPPAELPTVAFRVFYPCKQGSNERAVRWLPNPQREYLSAYAKFLGANSVFAKVFS